MNEVINGVWIWLGLGVFLLGAELLTGTFVLVFFGIGGILTAAAVALGLTDFFYQLIFFSAISAFCLFVFRKKFLRHFETGKSEPPDVHKTLSLSVSVPALAEATIEYQGSPWTAVNLSDRTLEAGSLAKIVRTEGIKLFISPVNSLEEAAWKLSQ